MTWSEIHRRTAAIHARVPVEAQRYARLTGMFAAPSYTANLALVKNVVTLLSQDLQVLADLLACPAAVTCTTTHHLVLLLLTNMEKRVRLTARHLTAMERRFAVVVIRAAALEAGWSSSPTCSPKTAGKTQDCAAPMREVGKGRRCSKHR
jgi:hypothetical protein